MNYSLNEMCEAGRTTERGVRLWDVKGLLGVVERSALNERMWTAEHVRRARIIAAAQTAGWPLARIRSYLGNASNEEQANLCSDIFNTSAFIQDVRAMLEKTETGQAWFDL